MNHNNCDPPTTFRSAKESSHSPSIKQDIKCSSICGFKNEALEIIFFLETFTPTKEQERKESSTKARIDENVGKHYPQFCHSLLLFGSPFALSLLSVCFHNSKSIYFPFFFFIYNFYTLYAQISLRELMKFPIIYKKVK